ncbi:MAG: methyltransferase [Alphaproteobacteria bacterium]|nr:methyltransferase [Alphaproteobacteria bacterium]
MIPSTEPGLTEDGLLGGRVRLLQPAKGYRVAVDAPLLAAAVEARPGERILDLGAGVGAVGLCLAARVPGCSITGIELQPALAELAKRNAELNGIADRFGILVHDLAAPLPVLKAFDHVVSNPPYLAAAVADPPPDAGKALATVESSADLQRWLRVATSTAKPAGTVLLIHRADRLDEIERALAALGWSDLLIKRLPPAPRVLVRARRARQFHRREVQPLVLHRPGGGYTDEAEAVLRGGAPLAF